MEKMAKRNKAHPDLSVPHASSQILFIGVDIGKFKHVAGFISKTLLERHPHARVVRPLFLSNREKAFEPLLNAFDPTALWNSVSFSWNKQAIIIAHCNTICSNLTFPSM